MRKLYLISKCVAAKKNISEFHFRGFFMGEKINKIQLKSDMPFLINRSYLIEVVNIKVSKNTIYGYSKRHKKLFY